jgi:hypothetical protein
LLKELYGEADHRHQLRCIVGVSSVREYVLFWIEMKGVFVSASMAFPLIRNRGPGINSWSIA